MFSDYVVGDNFLFVFECFVVEYGSFDVLFIVDVDDGPFLDCGDCGVVHGVYDHFII